MTTRVGLLDYSRVATNNRTIYIFIYLEEVLRQHSKERSGRTVTHYYTVIHSDIIYTVTLYTSVMQHSSETFQLDVRLTFKHSFT